MNKPIKGQTSSIPIKPSEEPLDLDLLIPYILHDENQKNPYIDLNKLDHVLREFNYHQEERRLIKKTLNLFKVNGLLTKEAFLSVFDIPKKESTSLEEEIVSEDDLALLFEMISSINGVKTQEIDLKKMKEYTKALDIDSNDDRTLSLMYKYVRNHETEKLMKEDLVNLAKNLAAERKKNMV